MKYSLQQPVLFDFFCYRMTGGLLSGSSCLLIPCLLGLPAANQPCSRLYLAYSSECQYRVFHGTFSAVHQSSCPQCCSCGVCTACCMEAHPATQDATLGASPLVSQQHLSVASAHGCFMQSCGFLSVLLSVGILGGGFLPQTRCTSHMLAPLPCAMGLWHFWPHRCC